MPEPEASSSRLQSAEAPQDATSPVGRRKLVVDDDMESERAATFNEAESVEALIPETLPAGPGPEISTEVPQQEPEPPVPDEQTTPQFVEPSESAQLVPDIPAQEVSIVEETIVTASFVSIPDQAGQLDVQIEENDTKEDLPTTINPDLIHVRPASELLGQTSNTNGAFATPSPKSKSKKRRLSEVPAVPAGTTPLRQEILRSREKRQRTIERQSRAGSNQKRATSPDRVYAFVGIPPRTSRSATETAPAPLPRPTRTPSPELTPTERQEKILRGSRIVNDVAAQYRAKVGALTRKYGIGPREISTATKEMREKGGKGSASGLDWDKLDSFLAQRYSK